MIPESSLESARAALDAYVDPYLGQSLAAVQAVREVRADGGGLTARIALGYPVGGYLEELTAALRGQLAAAGIRAPLTVELEADIRAHAVQRNLRPLGEISNVVAVASGKGGVGQVDGGRQPGARLGDPGRAGRPARCRHLRPEPAAHAGAHRAAPELAGRQAPASRSSRHGISAMSIGFLVDAEQPMVWRGPMVTQALTQLLSETQLGRRSTTWWSTCRPAPATSSSRSRSACRWPAR